MSELVSFTLADEIIERLAERAAEIVLERLEAARAEAQPEWLTPSAASAYTGWSRKRIYGLIHAERDPLPSVRHGERYLIRRADLDGWLVRRSLDTTEEEGVK